MAEPKLCEQYIGTLNRECGAEGARHYVSGMCCPDHTPARLAGRPENKPDPARSMTGLRLAAGVTTPLVTPDAPTVVDVRAIASGKRRSNPQDYRAAQAAAAQTANRTWAKPDLRSVPAETTPSAAAAAVWDPERLTRQARKVYDAMVDGHWHTLRELSDLSGAPEASVSARLRDLRGDEHRLPLEAEKIPGSNAWRYRLHVPSSKAG